MSESAPKSTIVLDVDAQGVTTGVNAAKKKLEDLGKVVTKVGDEFEKGGKQAEKAFDPVEKKLAATTRTTNALVNQLKNSIIDLKSAGDAATKYELRGLDKNIPSAVTAPLVAELRKLQVEQAAAAASALAASNSIAKTIVPTLEKTGMTAKATAAAMRSVPAQFTDIVVSLQGGQAPLTVMLQQGGQLKDMFGGIGNAASALGNYVKGLVSPFSLAAAGATALYLAYEAGAKESRAFNQALILSGNQAGTSASQMMAMAASIDQVSGTQGNAAEALALFAASGKIGAENLERFTLTAIRFEKVTGVAIGDTVKKFEALRKAPLAATLELNDSMGYLTQSVYEQIRALTEQGQIVEAAAVAQDAFNKATANMATDMEKNLGTVTRAWNSVKGAVTETWDAIKGIGRDAGLEGQVAAAQKMVDVRRQAANSIYGNESDRAKLSEAENQLKGYQELLKNQQLSNAQYAEGVQLTKDKAKFDKDGEKYLDKAVKMQRELNSARVEGMRLLKDNRITSEEYGERLQKIALSYADKPKAAGRTPRVKAEIDEAAKGLALYNDLQAKAAGYNANFTESVTELAKAYQLTSMSAEEYRGALDQILGQQPGAVAAAKALKDASAAADKYIDSLNKSADAVGAQLEKLQDEEKALLLSASANITLAEAIAEVEIARLREQQAIEMSFGNEGAVAAIQREIDARRELAQSINSKDAREAAKKGAEKAAEEWQKTADKINDTLTDALMRGFEDGKGFAEAFGDTLKNMFKTMVLRPIIQASLQPLSNAMSSGGGASGGGMGSLTSLFSSVDAGIANTMSGGVQALYSAGFDQLGDAAASLSNTVLKASDSVGGFSNALSYANALNTAFTRDAQGGKDYGKAAGQALGTYFGGPLGSFIGGEIGSALGLKDYSGTYHSGGTGAYSADMGMKYGATAYSFGMGASEYTQGANEQSAALAMAVSGIIDTASTIAGSDKKSFVGTGYADDISPDGAWAGLMIRLGDTLITDWGRGGDKWPGREFADGAAGQKQYLDAIAQDVRKAIDTIGLPEWATKYIDALGDGAGLEGLAQALEKIKLTEAAFGALGEVFTGLADLSDGAKTALLKVSGGIEALAGVASAYYDNFYTSEEKAARLTSKTAEAFETLGLVMPAINDATRENYRALIDELAAKDLSIEANAKAYAGALSLQGAMNELAPAFANAAKAANEAFGASANTAMSALKRSVDAQREIYQVQVDAAQEAVSEIQGIFDTLDSSIKTLYGQVESAQSAAQGKAFIANAASVAQRTGYLPDAEALSSAISAAMNDGTAYASQAEADFAKLELAGTLGVLQSASGKQLTAAEKQLDFAEQQIEKLDRTLEIAQAQLDAAMGIDNSVLSVVEALAEMNDALRGMIGAIIAMAQAGQISPADTAGRIAGSGLQKDTWSSVETATGMQSVYASLGGAAGVATKTGVDIYAKDNTKFTDLDAVKHINARLNSGAPELLYTDAIRTGVSAAAIDALMGWTAGTSNQWAQENDLPKFAQGINRVPYDMTARIHKDEAVVPAAFNPYNPNAQQGGNSNARLEGLVEGLTKEVQRLQSIVNDGNKSNERIASTLSDVTEGGSNMRTVAV